MPSNFLIFSSLLTDEELFFFYVESIFFQNSLFHLKILVHPKKTTTKTNKNRKVYRTESNFSILQAANSKLIVHCKYTGKFGCGVVRRFSRKAFAFVRQRQYKLLVGSLAFLSKGEINNTSRRAPEVTRPESAKVRNRPSLLVIRHGGRREVFQGKVRTSCDFGDCFNGLGLNIGPTDRFCNMWCQGERE